MSVKVQIFENWVNGQLDQYVGDTGTVEEVIAKLSDKYSGVFRLYETLIVDQDQVNLCLHRMTDEYWLV